MKKLTKMIMPPNVKGGKVGFRGGALGGLGGSTDTVPAMLTPHEAVLNVPAANMIGRNLIAKANAQGVKMMQPRGYQGGSPDVGNGRPDRLGPTGGRPPLSFFQSLPSFGKAQGVLFGGTPGQGNAGDQPDTTPPPIGPGPGPGIGSGALQPLVTSPGSPGTGSGALQPLVTAEGQAPAAQPDDQWSGQGSQRFPSLIGTPTRAQGYASGSANVGGIGYVPPQDVDPAWQQIALSGGGKIDVAALKAAAEKNGVNAQQVASLIKAAYGAYGGGGSSFPSGLSQGSGYGAGLDFSGVPTGNLSDMPGGMPTGYARGSSDIGWRMEPRRFAIGDADVGSDLRMEPLDIPPATMTPQFTTAPSVEPGGALNPSYPSVADYFSALAAQQPALAKAMVAYPNYQPTRFDLRMADAAFPGITIQGAAPIGAGISGGPTSFTSGAGGLYGAFEGGNTVPAPFVGSALAGLGVGGSSGLKPRYL